MLCSMCNNEALSVHFKEDKVFCGRCIMRMNPPKMKLARFRKDVYQNRLYNITYEVYENHMDIDTFISCGWFVRKESHRTMCIVYDLEYHGYTECDRCSGYHFPANFSLCTKGQLCRFIVAKARIPEIYLG